MTVFKKALFSLLELLISPAAQGMQEKQQMGLPLITAWRKPGRQLSLHTDRGLCNKITAHQYSQFVSPPIQILLQLIKYIFHHHSYVKTGV